MEPLLFLVHRIPYPPNKGDKIRSYHFLKYLANDYQIYLGTFIDDNNDWQYTDKVNALCAETHYEALNPLYAKIKSSQGLLTGDALSVPYYQNAAMQAWVNKTLKEQQISKVLIFSSVMMQFVIGKSLDVVIDFVDVDSDKWRQYAEKKTGVARWVYQREAKMLLRYEQHIAALAKHSLFVSEQEAALFKQLTPHLSKTIGHVNNGVDIDYFSPEHRFDSPYAADVQTLVFTGAMDYWANVDAVTWFAEQVFPAVLQENPNTLFYIVGSKPTKVVLDLANDNVIVTGRVEDVRPYLAYASLVVAPLRIARGIQNKVLEAMAMGKTVVASSAAIEGIPYTAQLDVIVVDEPLAMARQVSVLLRHSTNPSRANRQFVTDQFSWQQNVQQLSHFLRMR